MSKGGAEHSPMNSCNSNLGSPTSGNRQTVAITKKVINRYKVHFFLVKIDGYLEKSQPKIMKVWKRQVMTGLTNYAYFSSKTPLFLVKMI